MCETAASARRRVRAHVDTIGRYQQAPDLGLGRTEKYQALAFTITAINEPIFISARIEQAVGPPSQRQNMFLLRGIEHAPLALVRDLVDMATGTSAGVESPAGSIGSQAPHVGLR